MVSRTGFTLPEVMVAMMLLAIGAMGVAATGLLALQAFMRAELQEKALMEGQAVLDSLLALSAHTAGSRAVHGTTISWLPADSAGSVTVTVNLTRGQHIELAGHR
jgi:prepilin-type N-terminal cleavage/methylation domain-containing protein